MSDIIQHHHLSPIHCPFELFPEADLQSSIVDRFVRMAHRFGDRLAVRDCETSHTYAELAVMVRDTALAIGQATAGRAGPIAILLNPEARYPAAMLAALAAGRAYVPLDASAPIERNRTIVSATGVCTIVSAGDLLADAQAISGPGVSIVDFGEIGSERISLDPIHSCSDELAFIMHTSGSTGVSKSIAFNQRNILQNVMQYTNAIHISPDDRLLLARSFSVHGSVRTIYGALLNGASLHVLSPRHLGAASLARAIRDHGITIYFSAVTLLRRIAESLAPNERLDSVRIATIGSERVDWRDFDLCRRHFSEQVHVQTGLLSTESSGGICQWFVDASVRASGPRLPVGYSLQDRRFAFVGENGKPVADGEIGEIVVSTHHTALGYWRADGTIQPFPCDPDNPERKLLITGDLGRRRTDGLIEFIGRKDNVIKLHGQRIDCSEIEAALAQLREVHEAAVIVRKDEFGSARVLVGFVVLRPGNEGLLGRHLQAMLAQTLPSYMVPGRIVFIEQLPILASMKVDRIKLAEIDAAQKPDIRDRSDDALLDGVVVIYETALETVGASADDSVTSMGGDSLQSIVVMAEIERQFGIAVPDDLVLETPTIRTIANWLRSSGAVAAGEKQLSLTS